ncbi:methionyl-tRNA formyltransferase [Nitratireductor indicus C115]|uniref:Methionyl-tRNA formyltransferase n=1 Tax=Nitratireductor indicus C115 TaxID=1231190 RepID=K2NP91_9HYPH|nr:methionyl-tRNA formyltransferase [Nitratireductor indicus]EKF41195.1 methionyl-tRNA formyltransferase [Nitratireductor indicus C115]SFQ64649.1 methionyl-tRNA formyltransferase [Nitratireductor indicus]
MSLRLIFMGTPDFSVPTLQALSAAGHEIAAVYSQPPRPAGRRGLELTKSPVHQAAEALGIEVRTPKSLKGEDEQKAFADLHADAAIVVAYGLLLPKAILEGTRRGAFNAHASLLPRWRGAAPIQRAIMAGDRETGMMVMKMDEGLDTGPVAMTEKCAIGPDMTAGELHDAMKEMGAGLMVRAMAALEAGALSLTAQGEDGATYAKKILKDETRVDWAQTAETVHNHIRGLAPFPGAWCEMPFGDKDERVKLLRSTLQKDMSGEAGTVLDDALAIACDSGAVRLTQLQRAGGKPMEARDFLRGAKLERGTRLS